MQANEHILSDKLLHRFAERSGAYDRDNRFFHEDFEDLRDAGYLTMPVPKELGGAGFTLAQVCREQRRLGYYAPATALGINMHLYWVGVAADLWRQGDCSLEWMVKEAMEGEVFNAGHSERGNDLPVLLSTSKAERVDGGFRFTGPQDVRQHDAGLDAHGAARHLGRCRGRAEGRARLPAAQL
jgi:alkylation response protein AidB-like acyl-CoA dehydrogenase